MTEVAKKLLQYCCMSVFCSITLSASSLEKINRIKQTTLPHFVYFRKSRYFNATMESRFQVEKRVPKYGRIESHPGRLLNYLGPR